MFDSNQLAAIKVGLASPETIRGWSHGEVTKPETINYRSQKPEMGGLFCEKIFGPSKDYECHCGKYKKIRYKGITCEKCGVEVISKEFRRERFGHIELSEPCSHIWYLKGIPSRMGLLLGITPKELEEVVYFAAHLCLNAGTSTELSYKQFLDEKTARKTFQDVINNIPRIDEGSEPVDGSIVKGSADDLEAERLIDNMQNENETFDFFSAAAFISKYTGAEFGEGARAVKRLLREIDLDKEFRDISLEIKGFVPARRKKIAKLLNAVKGLNEDEEADAVLAEKIGDVVMGNGVIVFGKGNSSLENDTFISGNEAKDAFKAELAKILEPLKEDEEANASEIAKINGFIDMLNGPTDDCDFHKIAGYFHNKLGTDIEDGAVAIKRYMAASKNKDLESELDKLNKETKDFTNQKRIKLAKRLDAIGAFRESKQKPEWMVLDVIPVIPPDLRPMLQLDGGRFAASDLNDLYRRVISRNTRLKKLIDMNAPYVILMNEKRMLQEAVDALIDNGRRNKPVVGTAGRALKSLSNGLRGKQGRFRQNLLGKRVDYSGRSVIAVGPDLKMYQCGLPREMAIQLLRPFIASLLIQRGFVTAHRAADKMIDRYDPKVLDIVEEIISDHPVLLNRAPTLHRLGIQAFQPKLVDGHAIRLHPLVCTGFNADFDGDQMAVHVPLSKAAQEEAIKLMLASNNILGPSYGEPIAIPSQDMILGNYYLTVEETKKDFLERAEVLRKVETYDELEHRANIEKAEALEVYAEMEGKVFSHVSEVRRSYESGYITLHNRIAIRATSLHKSFGEEGKAGLPESVKDKYILTTVGKVIFNDVFPEDFPFINDSPKIMWKDKKPGALWKLVESWFVEPGTDFPAVLAKQPLKAPIEKKGLKVLISEVFNRYDLTDVTKTDREPSKTAAILDKIKDQGFKYSTYSSVTVALSDIVPVDGKEEVIAAAQRDVDKINEAAKKRGLFSEDERHEAVVARWQKCTGEVRDLVSASIKKDGKNPVIIMLDSGSRGSVDNFNQLEGMKGLVAAARASGQGDYTYEMPITSNYRVGLKVAEYFNNTHGSRKGGADTALKTADSGYLTRRLVDVAQDVVIREEDCQCDHGFKVREIKDTSRDALIESLSDRITGRFSMHAITNPETGEVIVPANTLITAAAAKEIVEAGIKEVEIRSIFTCQTKDGVCQHCYGINKATGHLAQIGDAVGIMAAQSIGEPGTQLTMRVFHTGGMAVSDITQGLPRVQELVEARPPKGEALISPIYGKVASITPTQDGRFEVVIEGLQRDNKTPTKDEPKKLITPFSSKLRVKVGDIVENGGKVTEGAINPKELLACSDVEKVEVYMVKEIKKVYAAQGIGISAQHLEVIVRQMLSKVTIVDGGDTPLLPGTAVSNQRFIEENSKALLAGKRPAMANPLILGITKAALQTDSFLSAASFQETTKVLTDAAIKAKKDPLHGLKENVIAGKLIPAGTGLRTAEQVEEALADFTVADAMAEVKDKYVEKHERPGSTN